MQALCFEDDSGCAFFLHATFGALGTDLSPPAWNLFKNCPSRLCQQAPRLAAQPAFLFWRLVHSNKCKWALIWHSYAVRHSSWLWSCVTALGNESFGLKHFELKRRALRVVHLGAQQTKLWQLVPQQCNRKSARYAYIRSRLPSCLICVKPTKLSRSLGCKAHTGGQSTMSKGSRRPSGKRQLRTRKSADAVDARNTGQHGRHTLGHQLSHLKLNLGTRA